MLDLLKDKNFRLLWLGQMCSQLGDRLTQLVLIALVAFRTSGSTLTLAKVLVFTSLPALLVNPFAGAYVDRWDRRRTMMVCDFLRAAVIVSLPWLMGLPSFVPLYAAVFILYAVAGFFVPARLAVIPDLVDSSQLAKANALFTSSGMIGSTVILLVGALLVEWVGATKSCFVNAAGYIASALFIAPIAVRSCGIRKHLESPRAILVEVAEGMAQLWKDPKTRQAAGFIGVLMAGAGASIVVATVMVQQYLGTVTKDLGFLSLWTGIGMLAGTILFGRWGIRWPRQAVLGISFMGCGISIWLFIGAVQFLHSGAAASGSTALLGIAIAPIGILTNTMVHEGHPERLQGRVFSSLGVVVNISLILAMLLAGWMVEQGGRGTLMAAIGGLFAVSGLFVLVRGRSAVY